MPQKHNSGHIGHQGILNPATIILMCAVVLSILGITILFSASVTLDDKEPYQYIEKQALWMGITLVIGSLVALIDLEKARKFIWLGFVVMALLLIAVAIPGVGTKVNGSRSWIRLGPVSLQVAEFAKIGVVFFLAHYFSLARNENRTFRKGFFYPCLGLGFIVALILAQPDLGTALIICITAFCLLFMAGVNAWYLIPTATVGIVGMIFAVQQFSAERWSRFTAFLDMEGQKSDQAYQVWQALLAFGVGSVEGVGLGNGRQQLSSLPEAHTDFIFAIIGEELGLIATMTVLLVYSLIFVMGLSLLRRAPNTYQSLLGWGCLLLITVQALVNLGVVTGSLPTTGLPLPFISYGGSNFLTMGVCVALLINMSRAWRNPALKESGRKLKEIDS